MVLWQDVCGFGKKGFPGLRGVTALIGGVDQSVYETCGFRIHYRLLQFQPFLEQCDAYDPC
jgi:hypothetical protein